MDCPICGEHVYQCEACGGTGCDQCHGGLLLHTDANHRMNFQRLKDLVHALGKENVELRRLIHAHEVDAAGRAPDSRK